MIHLKLPIYIFHMPFLNKGILITIKNTLEEKFYTTFTSISYYTLFHM